MVSEEVVEPATLEPFVEFEPLEFCPGEGLGCEEPWEDCCDCCDDWPCEACCELPPPELHGAKSVAVGTVVVNGTVTVMGT
jgi:hypothetical protein